MQAEIAKLPESTRNALLWMGAFGEGIAMLAAAGGPDVHPHAVSKAADRERWDRDAARFPEDLRKLEAFFRDLLAGRSDRVGVTGVAMRLGFFHLSRFAGQYARLFGETPSQTVRLAAGRTLASSGPTHPVIQPQTRMITVP